MASTSFAARPWALSSLDYSSTNTRPLEPHSDNARSDNNTLHAHRQNHNSSKLPAFRFADLRKDRISLPSLHQPAPLAPVLSQTVTVDPPEPTRRIPELSHNNLHRSSSTPTLPDRPAAFESKQSSGATRSRSLRTQSSLTETTSGDDVAVRSKRPTSLPETHKNNPRGASATQSQSATVAASAIRRRLTESAVQESAQGQREPLLPRSLRAAELDDNKPRPPVTYNLHTTAGAASTSSGRAAIPPPISSFRSSGSRKSAVLDMPARHTSGDFYHGETLDTNQRDRALRALEGQRDEDFSHMAPAEPGEMTTTTDNDNTADIFMKIAGEDPAPRALEKQAAPAESSVISRIVRTSHRRPFSTSSPAQDTSSPPRVSRRLSDQRESSRSRQAAADSQSPQTLSRESSYRTPGRESLPPIATSAESSSRTQPGRGSSRPSPITPRQISFRDSFADSSSAYQRRRQSLTENHSLPSPRAAHYRSSNLAAATQARTYHSSPLVPKSANVLADAQQPNNSDTNHGVEGTESSSSTAAPSSVWDELDDLKSRIHRLELTGKMPSTSGGGMSRSSDERPRTATTNATTVSASPKRDSKVGSSQPEVHSNQPALREAPREAQPLLLSALSKTKNLVSAEVFSAIESAATDAMALSSMIGVVGQPGPVSSSASTIGGYNNGGVTDRQLRKKADSICRSLTELCIALADTTKQKKQHQPTSVAPEQEATISPTSNLTVVDTPPSQRRASAVADMIAKESTSPRAPSSLEQKRKTMLASISLPTSRYVTAPSTPLESTAGRKSSLLLARIRRAATEEPEEAQSQTPQAGRRSSLLLRSRRNGSEEPDENREGRKTSLLLRSRKTTTSDGEEEDLRVRGPSRAVTEVNGFRSVSHDLVVPTAKTQAAPEGPATPSALPRRRAIPSAIATRLASAVPSASTPTTPARRYLERNSLQERNTPQERGTYQERAINTLSERLAEERGQQQQRQSSLGQTAILNRSGSLGRRTRESGIPSLRS
ncbi:hypothetical protein VTI28DRAFT_10522 [Corynascus sepedonium]